eukprot:260059-Chlamydomonas_euryale.AAC.3
MRCALGVGASRAGGLAASTRQAPQPHDVAADGPFFDSWPRRLHIVSPLPSPRPFPVFAAAAAAAGHLPPVAPRAADGAGRLCAGAARERGPPIGLNGRGGRRG